MMSSPPPRLRPPPPPLPGRDCKQVPPIHALLTSSAVISLTFAFVAIVGNGLIILAVLLDPMKKIRTPFSYFLVNLAVSDFIAGCVAMPMSAALDIIMLDGPLPITLSDGIHIFILISAMSSLLSLMALCLDRYFAIKWPIRYRTVLSWKRCALMSLAIWALSIGLPFLKMLAKYPYFLFIYLHVAIAISLPILFITTYYSRKVINKSRRDMSELRARNSPRDPRHDKMATSARRKVSRVFTVIILLFIATYVPALVISYVERNATFDNCHPHDIMRTVITLLLFANSCVNPIVCMVLMRNFRRSVVLIIAKCCPRASGQLKPSDLPMTPSSQVKSLNHHLEVPSADTASTSATDNYRP